jgi:hypothetical protein
LLLCVFAFVLIDLRARCAALVPLADFILPLKLNETTFTEESETDVRKRLAEPSVGCASDSSVAVCLLLFVVLCRLRGSTILRGVASPRSAPSPLDAEKR